MRINHDIATKVTQELNIEADVVQQVGTGVIIRALKNYQAHIENSAKGDWSNLTEQSQYDHFDTVGLIAMMEMGSVLITLTNEDVDKFGVGTGCDYPAFVEGTMINL